jgi:hypothetical protein
MISESRPPTTTRLKPVRMSGAWTSASIDPPGPKSEAAAVFVPKFV